MSTAAPALSGSMDVDEFMAFLETRPNGERWELIEGAAVMMTPPTLAHQRIASNLLTLLNRSFAAQALDLYAYHEIAVRLPGLRNFQPEPDVTVVPGPAGYETYAERFRLVAEILSPTNTRHEIGIKRRRYQDAPENLYVLVIESRRMLLELYARSSGWAPAVLSSAEAELDLPELGFSCALGRLYQGTPLDPLAK